MTQDQQAELFAKIMVIAIVLCVIALAWRLLVTWALIQIGRMLRALVMLPFVIVGYVLKKMFLSPPPPLPHS